MTKRATFTLLLGSIVSGIVASPASAQITPISATVRINALANATQGESNDPTGDVTDNKEQSWGTLLSYLSVDVLADAESPVEGRIKTQGFAQSFWNSESSGGVIFSGMGWFNEGYNGAGKAILSGTNWEYTFHTDSDNNFQVNYTASASGFTFGLQGFDVSVEGGPEGSQFADFKDVSDPTTTSNHTFNLTAGNDYTVKFNNNANLTGGIQSGTMDVNFSWQITPVPAPSSALTALLGLLPAGAIVVRRRRK